MKRVSPLYLVCNGLWNVFTKRKKYIIACGFCGHTYKDKVFFITDEATSICPACSVLNVWSHSKANQDYQNKIQSLYRKS